MTCEECTQKLLELPVDRFGELKEHLDGCPKCRAKAERIRATEAEHKRILAEDADLPPVRDDGTMEEGAQTNRVVGLSAFNAIGKGNQTRGSFYKPFTLAIVITAIIAVIMGPRLLKTTSVVDQAPKPTITDVVSILGGTPTDISAPTAPARVSIVPVIRQEGRKVRAPHSIPPRTWVWFMLSATQNANVDLCMSWPGATQAIWSGYLGPGRVEVPPDGYVMDITGEYTFSLSRAGDGSCRDPEGEIKLEVQP